MIEVLNWMAEHPWLSTLWLYLVCWGVANIANTNIDNSRECDCDHEVEAKKEV